MKINPLLLCDWYKHSHRPQYPDHTQYVSANSTARGSRIEGVNHIVVFGIQYLLKEYLIDCWNENFFKKREYIAIEEFKAIADHCLGKDAIDVQCFRDLHRLGYLPIKIKALPEGTVCPTGVPFMTVVNTLPEFFWLTNFIETLTQTVIWQPITSATIALEYRKLLDKYAKETSDIEWFVDWQGHDFSMRGMSSPESGLTSGMAHLLSFKGTDTITGVWGLKEYYGARLDSGPIAGSVSATEHATMCAGGKEDEKQTYLRLLTKVYPSGIVSVVSDTWDYWKVLTETIPSIKDVIMNREGKLVVRPDSGDPVKIVTGYFSRDIIINYQRVMDKCSTEIGRYNFIVDNFGDNDAIRTSDGIYLNANLEKLTEAEVKGSIQILAETFGYTVNSKGYKDLDPHIGLIYGDSITIERCRKICERLKLKGFASTNVVFGIGSYTYQYNTRDTFSIACKATHVIIDGNAMPIFKDPATGKSKKSAKGLLMVVRENGELVLHDDVLPHEEELGELKVVFLDGKLMKDYTLNDVKENLHAKRVH